MNVHDNEKARKVLDAAAAGAGAMLSVQLVIRFVHETMWRFGDRFDLQECAVGLRQMAKTCNLMADQLTAKDEPGEGN
jgi:hypothetical protein